MQITWSETCSFRGYRMFVAATKVFVSVSE
jgi:hypothetical protein